jgi:putative peptidoglycan lipid II flippase
LTAYALGLPAFMLIKILAPAFFSRQNTRTPVKIGIWAMVLNMVLNLLLIVPLAHMGLALATALSAWFNAGWLALTLHRQKDFPAISLWVTGVLKATLAAIFMSLVLLGVMSLEAFAFPADVWGRVWRLLVLVLAGLGSYGLALLVLGVRPRDLLH